MNSRLFWKLRADIKSNWIRGIVLRLMHLKISQFSQCWLKTSTRKDTVLFGRAMALENWMDYAALQSATPTALNYGRGVEKSIMYNISKTNLCPS